MESPTLIIHTFYENCWYSPSLEDTPHLSSSHGKQQQQQHSPVSWTMPPHAPPPVFGALCHTGGLLPSLSLTNIQGYLQDGTYTAQLDIEEEGTIVHAAYNTTFDVVAIHLRVTFIDGSEREVDPSSNITLQVEVTSSSPNYTISWECHVFNSREPCFEDPDPWDNFSSSSHLADGIFSQLHHLWDILHGDDGYFSSAKDQPMENGNGRREGKEDDLSGLRSNSRVPPLAMANGFLAKGQFRGEGNVTSQSTSSGKDPTSLHIPDFLKNKWHYIETITFPASLLKELPMTRYVFRVICSHRLKYDSDEQNIIVAIKHRDNIGIKSHLGSQSPFGASRRMVFESECNGCSQEDIDALQYTWKLKVILSNNWSSTHREEFLPDEDTIETAIQEALRGSQTRPEFMARPKDYLRVYYKSSVLSYIMKHESHRSTNDSEDALVEDIYISKEDLENLPAPITADLVAKAWDIYYRSGEYRVASRRKKLEDAADGKMVGDDDSPKNRVRRNLWMISHPEKEKKILGTSPPAAGDRVTEWDSSLPQEMASSARQEMNSRTEVAEEIEEEEVEEKKRAIIKESTILIKEKGLDEERGRGVRPPKHQHPHQSSPLSHSPRTSMYLGDDNPDQPSSAEDHPEAVSTAASGNDRLGSPPVLPTIKDDESRRGNGEGQNTPTHHPVSLEGASRTWSVWGDERDGQLIKGSVTGGVEYENGRKRVMSEKGGERIGSGHSSDKGVIYNEQIPLSSKYVGTLDRHDVEVTDKEFLENIQSDDTKTHEKLRDAPRNKKTRDTPTNLLENKRKKRSDRTRGKTGVTIAERTEVEHDSMEEVESHDSERRRRNDFKNRRPKETLGKKTPRLADELHRTTTSVNGALPYEWVEEVVGSDKETRMPVLPPPVSSYPYRLSERERTKERTENLKQDDVQNLEEKTLSHVIQTNGNVQGIAGKGALMERDERREKRGSEGSNEVSEEIRYDHEGKDNHLTSERRVKVVDNDGNDIGMEEVIDAREDENDMPGFESNEGKVAQMNPGGANHKRDAPPLPLATTTITTTGDSPPLTTTTALKQEGEWESTPFSHPSSPLRYLLKIGEESASSSLDLDGRRKTYRRGWISQAKANEGRDDQKDVKKAEGDYATRDDTSETLTSSRGQDDNSIISATHTTLPLLRGESSPRSALLTSSVEPSDPRYSSSPSSSPSSLRSSSQFIRSPLSSSQPFHIPYISPSSSSQLSDRGVLDYKEYTRLKFNLPQFRRQSTSHESPRKFVPSRRNPLQFGHEDGLNIASSEDQTKYVGADGVSVTPPIRPPTAVGGVSAPEHARTRSRGQNISSAKNLKGQEVTATSHPGNSFRGIPTDSISARDGENRLPQDESSSGENDERSDRPGSMNSLPRDEDGGWASIPKSTMPHRPSLANTAFEDVPLPVQNPRKQGALVEFAASTGEVPDFSCPWHQWYLCRQEATDEGSAHHTIATLNKTLGDPNQGDSVMREESPKEVTNILDENQMDVIFFTQFTSTGVHEPVLVLYRDWLYASLSYVLYLKTVNSRTQHEGLAKQVIKFSPAPTLNDCQVRSLQVEDQRNMFQASCTEVRGNYYPIYLQWSYQFLRRGAKTIFYHGTRTNFQFSLPPGLEATDYQIYISVRAIDGKGVSFQYPHTQEVTVFPRASSGDGVLSIFEDVSTLVNESPSLLLQQVRSLTFELNLIAVNYVTQTILDNILALVFFGNQCQDSLETVTDPSSFQWKFQDFFQLNIDKDHSDLFIEINLLKSCARDHLAEIVVELPLRDEMEVLQALTALQSIVDAESLSSKTYSRVITAMQSASLQMWWSYNPELRTEAAEQYFLLSSSVLDQQFHIYDWESTSVELICKVISMLLNAMKVETQTRFLEESPLIYSSSTLTFVGYLSDADSINRWNKKVPFIFKSGTIPHGVHLVQSLIHEQSPYNVTSGPITSIVVNVDLHVLHSATREVKVTLSRSKVATKGDYDFRREGILTPQSLSVYEFEVGAEHDDMAFNVVLQIMQVFNPNYPVAAVVLICQDLQNLHNPIYKKEVPATVYATQVQLSLPPGAFSAGTKLLIIMDKNSYENNWARHNKSDDKQGGSFEVAGWWAQCLVWNNIEWEKGHCTVVENETTWDITTCNCASNDSVYGAKVIPILDKESKIDVNELLLVETYGALYFIITVLVLYAGLALALQTSERHRLKRRNIWLRDNKPEHEWAYLLTIKTGTQWNAGTTSKVYAIIHGTHGMSETRELQSNQTGQLFTRGSLCTFILTTAEPLGDILKVQVWHDNSGGSNCGWYVCETSIADLVLGARYAYPCYRWLSVQAEDAKVEREITLESPTTFFQDFEHFLPQYASEHMLWTSLLTTSNAAKFFRLQRLTICLIVCLCLGTLSLAVVQKINTEHTMMVPDMHIESLYYGFMIAFLLLPVQWLLEMVFKMSNRLEEKEYNNKTVLDTLKATLKTTPNDAFEKGSTVSQNNSESSDEDNDNSELYDPNSTVWTSLTEWAHSVEVVNTHTQVLHPALRHLEKESVQVTHRSHTNIIASNRPDVVTDDSPSGSVPEQSSIGVVQANFSRRQNGSQEDNSWKKCSPVIFQFFSELRRTFSYLLFFLRRPKKSKFRKKSRQEEEGWAHDDDDDEDDDDDDDDEFSLMSNITFIFSQCIGWIVCCIFVALCCMTLFVRGSGMPADYSALWLHIIYITLCCSVFIMQPFVVVIYTLYKVCMYRWLGCRGCISSCVTVPLDQVVAIWNRYQSVLSKYGSFTQSAYHDKLLQDRQRKRDLRFAHPPSEDYLLTCREREVRQERVSRLLFSAIGYLMLLTLLLIISSKANVLERFRLNQAIYDAMENGACLDNDRYLDPCTETESFDSCNQEEDPSYKSFKNISDKDDWWVWANSELLALTDNTDGDYSNFNLFCDTNSIIIGGPRIRKYDIYSEECAAAKFKVEENTSFADFLNVKNCYPDYIDVAHLVGFNAFNNKEYEWDAHFLAINHGLFSQYSYTENKLNLDTSRVLNTLKFLMLRELNWIDNATRAVVTEYTLYHPPSKLYTSINLLVEFPSVSGAKVMTHVWSTDVERYRGGWAYVCMFAEILLLAVAMYYLYHSVIYLYSCKFRIWHSFWGILDLMMTIFSWSYVVCLMLRVNIAEDIMWQLRVAYFRTFVNLKSLVTWDNILEAQMGAMITVHLLRCLELMKYIPTLRRLGLTLASAAKDVMIISIFQLVMLLCCLFLGYLWFNTSLWEFHTFLEVLLTTFRTLMAHLPILKYIDEGLSGFPAFLGKLYFLVNFVLLFQLTRALYVAAFLYARKSYKAKSRMDMTAGDIKNYFSSKWEGVKAKITKEQSYPDDRKDNIPPDFYMAEIEMQINQVQNNLDNLADSLGIVLEHMSELDTESADCDSISSNEDESPQIRKICDDSDISWNPEDFRDGRVKSSTFKTELEAMLEPLQSRMQQLLDDDDQTNETEEHISVEKNIVNSVENALDGTFNLDAFTEIASCQTEIEALSRKWNLASLSSAIQVKSEDNGEQLQKFLKDVSAASDELRPVTSFGKYGKTSGKLNTKFSSKTLANSENLNALKMQSNREMPYPCNFAKQSMAHTQKNNGYENQIHSSSAAMLSSNLRRTKTHGRGKGHVDVLDIESFKTDSDEEC